MNDSIEPNRFLDANRETPTMTNPPRFHLRWPRAAPCIACATALVILYVCGRSAGAQTVGENGGEHVEEHAVLASGSWAPSAFAGPILAAQDGPRIAPPMDDAQRELIELFGKVETRLVEIDKLLSDAGAGDTSALEKVGPSGIDELLKRSKAEGERAIQDIDRILEIAQQMQQQQSSSSSGQGQGKPQSGGGQGQQQQQGQDGQSPLDGQGNTSTQREQTPTGPEQSGGQEPKDKDGQNGSKPQGQDGQSDSSKDGQKPKGDGKPKDGSASQSDPKNQQSGPPPGSGRGAASSTADGKERWGDLPVHARDVFRNEGGRDMPVQYRDWIDAYYRRLNKKGP